MLKINSTYNRLFKLVAISFFMIGLISCSSKPVVHELPASASPMEELTKLEDDINQAAGQEVNILSPENFKQAKTELENAKKTFVNGKDSEKTLHNISVSRSYLDSAIKFSAISKEKIEDVVSARTKAIESKAPGYFPNEFKNVDNDLANLTKDIEHNRLGSMSSIRPKLQAKYLDLELRSIKEKYLGESRNIINQAKNEEAKKYAPQTLALAEKSFEDTSAFIIANRDSIAEIENRAIQTKEAALSVYNINRQAKGATKVSAEELALMIDKEKKNANLSETKAAIIEDELATTQSSLEKEKAAQVALEQSKADIELQKNKLEADKSLNDKYEMALTQFSPEEAEVYKQGENLIIRLKGIQFPTAKATIPGQNYPLLNKIENIVENFGKNSKVTIEGHTDSIGKKSLNSKLSEHRAKAVKEYLEANAGGIKVDIEAVGYGDKKPISTNKTALGRAQNRRVDIIIKPEPTKL